MACLTLKLELTFILSFPKISRQGDPIRWSLAAWAGVIQPWLSFFYLFSDHESSQLLGNLSEGRGSGKMLLSILMP